MIAIPVYIFLLFELIAVSYIDLKHKKISNKWPLLNVLAFAILVFLIPEHYKFISHGKVNLDQIFLSLVFLFVGFLLFLTKIMGGGDSKYLFSLYLTIPYTLQEKAFLFLLYSTIIIGSFLLIANIIKNLDVIYQVIRNGNIKRLQKVFGSKFPYAPVILISWIWLGIDIGIFSL